MSKTNTTLHLCPPLNYLGQIGKLNGRVNFIQRHSAPKDTELHLWDWRSNYCIGNLFQRVPLPETASPTQVVAKVVGKIPILEIRQVHISYGEQMAVAPETTSYTAVLVGTGSGQKVVLLQFHKNKFNPPGGWWSQIYDLQAN